MRFDPTSPAVKADPYPAYMHLREEAPIAWNDAGFWTIARNSDCLKLLRDKRMGKAHPFAWEADHPDLPLVAVHKAMMIFQDGTPHLRLRRLFTSVFTRKAVEDLRPGIAAMTDSLLDGLRGRDEVDLVSEFCFPITLGTICQMLGVPECDIDYCYRLMSTVQRLHEHDLTDIELQLISDNTVELAGYFAEHVRDRKKNPKDDLITLLVQAEVDGEYLSEDEIVANAILMYLGGEDTNAYLMANSTLALLSSPDQADVLRTDQEVVETTAFDEMLRYDSSIQMMPRHVFEDFEYGGVTFEAGQTVMCLLGSANRDELEYENPDVIDLRRQVNRGVGFGGGPHLCLGAPLARVQLKEALPRLFRTFPEMALVSAELEYELLVVRGPKELRLSLGRDRQLVS